MKGLHWERKHLTMQPNLLCMWVFSLYYVPHKRVNLFRVEEVFARCRARSCKFAVDGACFLVYYEAKALQGGKLIWYSVMLVCISMKAARS